MVNDGRLEEVKDTWKYFHKDADEDEIPTDDEFVDEELGIWHVYYPEELQGLEGEQD